jgi:hypothetical protein
LSWNSKLKTQNSKLKTQNSKLKTQNSKLKTQNSKLKTQNSKLNNPHHCIAAQIPMLVISVCRLQAIAGMTDIAEASTNLFSS